MESPQRDTGWIEVVCGPMFSGKTEELIRRLRRAVIGRQRVQVFKPAIDTRYHESRITSHSSQSLEAAPVADVAKLLEAIAPETRVVGIDEAQFFGPGLVPAVQSLADRGLRVVIAGLDQDYRGEPFEPMPQLLAIAEQVTKCLAICARCGSLASRSYRFGPGEERVLVGASDTYEARCRRCFHEGPRCLARGAA